MKSSKQPRKRRAFPHSNIHSICLDDPTLYLFGSRDCQVLQQEVERLEARAALVEEEASRAGQLEEEAAARAEQLRALQEKARAPKRLRGKPKQQYNSSSQ